MPKTMPPLMVAGKRLSPSAITFTGVGIATIASLALVALARVLT